MPTSDSVKAIGAAVVVAGGSAGGAGGAGGGSSGGALLPTSDSVKAIGAAVAWDLDSSRPCGGEKFLMLHDRCVGVWWRTVANGRGGRVQEGGGGGEVAGGWREEAVCMRCPGLVGVEIPVRAGGHPLPLQVAQAAQGLPDPFP